MYNGIKRDLGPSEKKTVPLKTKYREPIIDLKKEMDRLVKHYSELYLRETDFIAATLNSYTTPVTVSLTLILPLNNLARL